MFVTIYNPAPIGRVFDAEGHMVDGLSWGTTDPDVEPAKSLIASRHLQVVGPIKVAEDTHHAAAAAQKDTDARNAAKPASAPAAPTVAAATAEVETATNDLKAAEAATSTPTKAV
jgi:hypothetical protein